MGQSHFTAERIHHRIDTMIHQNSGRPPVVIFGCRWNGATNTLSDEMSAEIIWVMCAGRVVAGDVLKAFEKGAAGVLIVGCATQECHYGFGYRRADENLRRVSDFLSLLGFEGKRLRLAQIPADHGPELAALLDGFSRQIETLGSNRWAEGCG
jgi:coenzyme F420-reducing hydrogenase delta subunit